jgi:phosphatidylserine/phosphatidylglycerophosphate/cardiolipin synthase-like enzyme
MLDEIYQALGGDSGRYHGSSYGLTDHNRYELLSTPDLWGHDPTKIDYVPTAKNLTDGIKDVIASAKFTVDISTMAGSPTSADQPPFPDGPFLKAISDGLKAAALNSNRLVARIIFGLPPYMVIVAPRLTTWLDQLDLPPSVPVYAGVMATVAPIAVSFNHAKLVVADGQRGICGGHNLWDKSYCEVAPVHDVSVRLDGPANLVAQRFLNIQWNKMARVSRPSGGPVCFLRFRGKTYPNALPLIQRTPPAEGNGTTRVLSVGRLGRGLIDTPADAVASRTARLKAVGLATRSIKLAQQMLGGPFLGPYDEGFMTAIGEAIGRRVNVEVVISDTKTRTGYYGYTVEETCKKLFEEVGKATRKTNSEVAALCAQYAHVAVLRFVAKKVGDPDDYWRWMLRDGTRQSPANHSKVYIIDDTLFYVGSDNAYSPDTAINNNPEGFQEFGHIISGATETQAFLTNYWNKLWGYSGPYEFKGWARFVTERAEESSWNATPAAAEPAEPVELVSTIARTGLVAVAEPTGPGVSTGANKPIGPTEPTQPTGGN